MPHCRHLTVIRKPARLGNILRRRHSAPESRSPCSSRPRANSRFTCASCHPAIKPRIAGEGVADPSDCFSRLADLILSIRHRARLRARIRWLLRLCHTGSFGTSPNITKEECLRPCCFSPEADILLRGLSEGLSRRLWQTFARGPVISVAREPLTLEPNWQKLLLTACRCVAPGIICGAVVRCASLPLFRVGCHRHQPRGFTPVPHSITSSPFQSCRRCSRGSPLDFLVRVLAGVTTAFFEDCVGAKLPQYFRDAPHECRIPEWTSSLPSS